MKLKAFGDENMAHLSAYYYSEEKHPFYMHGVVAKNKKTIYLMDKYCPKKH